MARKKQTPEPNEEFLIKFSCTLTFEGAVFIDGTSKTAARDAERVSSRMPLDAIRRWMTEEIERTLHIRSVTKATQAQATLGKVSRDLESPCF